MLEADSVHSSSSSSSSSRGDDTLPYDLRQVPECLLIRQIINMNFS